MRKVRPEIGVHSSGADEVDRLWLVIEPFSDISFEPSIALASAQIVPVLMLALVIEFRSLTSRAKRIWEDARQVIGVMGVIGAVSVLAFLFAANNVDALTGSTALGLWALTISVISGFTGLLVLSMNTGLKLEERLHNEELASAAAPSAHEKGWWRFR